MSFKMALEGVRVIDLSTSYSAPIGTMQLADFGADVIKVENTGAGDYSRTWAPFIEGESMGYMYANRNKRSITLNLKSEKGKEILFDLIRTADVVVENFRPGTMKKLGLEYEVIKSVKPDIIMASLSGYGQTGPDAHKGAYSNLAEAQSGIMSMTGWPESLPTGSGVALGDSIAGMYMVQGILYALFHHERTGEGQYIDVAMVDSLIGMLERAFIVYSITGKDPEPMGNRDVSEYPYDTFLAKDGYCQIGNANQSNWKPFAEAIGRPDLGDHPDYQTADQRWEHFEEIHGILEKWCAERTRAEIEEALTSKGQLYSPILKPSEVMELPQVKHRNMIVDMEYRGIKYKDKGIAVKMSGTPGSIRKMPPTQGENTEEVLSELGYSAEDMENLRAEGVIK